MIRIEVEKTNVKEKSGVKNGKPWTIREQEAWAHILGDDGKPGRYPVKMKMQLEKEQEPFAPGLYILEPRSVMVGDFDQLTVGRVYLVPVKQ